MKYSALTSSGIDSIGVTAKTVTNTSWPDRNISSTIIFGGEVYETKGYLKEL